MLEGKKLLIFDCDGVLIDSYEANAAYLDHCLKEAGCQPLNQEFRDKTLYMSVEQLIYEMFDEKEASRIFRVSQMVPYDPFLGMINVLFDSNAVLGELRKRFFLSVASNRAKSLVTIFRHFNFFDYFHFKLSALEARAKPDPDMLNKSIEYFGVDKKEALFFGDSVSDCTAAANAGIDFVWIGKGGTPSIKSVAELLEYLESDIVICKKEKNQTG